MNPPYPIYTGEEARSRETFLALMWALSYPGRVYEVPPASADVPGDIAILAQIGDALVDLETTYYTPTPALASRLVHTAARPHPVKTAAYHFYPSVGIDDLATIVQASIGTTLFPDQSATLFLGCTRNTLTETVDGIGTLLTLHGPGIYGQQQVRIQGIPDALWALRKRAVYPLGWDIYVVDPVGRIIGLPRSTKIDLEGQD